MAKNRETHGLGPASILIALLMVMPAASAGCACAQPGDPGVPVAFDASRTGGTTDDVSFYIPAAENGSKPGQIIAIWARKDLDGTLVPIKNLDIAVNVDSREFEDLSTDEDGYASFTASEPGSYAISGGDADYSFEVIAPPAPEERLDEGPEPVVEAPAASEGAAGAPAAEEAEAAVDGDPAGANEDGTVKASDELIIYATIAAISAIAAVIVLKRVKNEKGRKGRKQQ